MAKPTEKEYFVAFTVMTVLTILVIGFYFTWMSKNSPRDRIAVAYTSFGPIVVTNQTYSIKTNISVQTTGEDEIWIKKNKASLESILKNSLANSDPKIVLGANGLQSIQDSLRNVSNKAFNTTAVKNVFFTDFVLVMNNSQ